MPCVLHLVKTGGNWRIKLHIINYIIFYPWALSQISPPPFVRGRWWGCGVVGSRYIRCMHTSKRTMQVHPDVPIVAMLNHTICLAVLSQLYDLGAYFFLHNFWHTKQLVGIRAQIVNLWLVVMWALDSREWCLFGFKCIVYLAS